jgi:hypothetical protein
VSPGGQPPGKNNENRAFCNGMATASRYGRTLFQLLTRKIRYLGEQWNFCRRSTNLIRRINRKTIEFRAARENGEMW